MRVLNGAGPAHCFDSDEARSFVGVGEHDGQTSKPAQFNTQAVIIGQLSGDDTCMAAGLSVVGITTVLDLCRMLVQRGDDHKMPMEVFRHGVLALRIRSIGEAAKLEINGKGTRFKKCRQPVGTAPPLRPDVPEHHPPCGLPLGKAAPIIGSDGGVP